MTNSGILILKDEDFIFESNYDDSHTVLDIKELIEEEILIHSEFTHPSILMANNTEYVVCYVETIFKLSKILKFMERKTKASSDIFRNVDIVDGVPSDISYISKGILNSSIDDTLNTAKEQIFSPECNFFDILESDNGISFMSSKGFLTASLILQIKSKEVS